MYRGIYPAAGFRGGTPPSIPGLGLDFQRAGDPIYPGGRTFLLTEIRADWKEHASSFRLQHHFTCNRICHQCLASRTDPAFPFTDFRLNASWRGSMRSNRQFLLEELGDPVNMLVYVAKFHYTIIKWDAMHAVNLGCGLFANGGAWFELLKIQWFGNNDKPTQFRIAYRMFKRFLQRNNIVSSQPMFKTWMLVMTGEEYCFFASKVGICLNTVG